MAAYGNIGKPHHSLTGHSFTFTKNFTTEKFKDTSFRDQKAE